MKFQNLMNVLIILSLAFLVMQTVQAKDEPPELKDNVVPIQDIIKDKDSYMSKLVVVEGKIDQECGSGCWFIINDDSASIYVDILPSNFVIPQKRGSDAKVYGKVSDKDGDPYIIGKIVEIGGEIYQ